MSDELKPYVLQSYEPQPYGTDEPTTDPVESDEDRDAGCCTAPPDPDPGPPKG
jgi:hypothetical protein